MALVLYHSLFSTCSQKVRLCLAEKELDWTSEHIDLYKNEQLSKDYLAINPNGVVPTLVHNGAVVTDSSVIIEYLDEVFPHRSLTPSTPYARAKMRSWMRFFEEVPTVAIRTPSFRRVFSHHFSQLSAEQLEQENSMRTVRKEFFKKMGTDGFSKVAEDEDISRLNLTLSRMEKALSNHQWLLGEAVSLADFVILPILVRMEDLGLLYDVGKPYPKTLAWYQHMEQRPSFNMAFPTGSRDLTLVQPA